GGRIGIDSSGGGDECPDVLIESPGSSRRFRCSEPCRLNGRSAKFREKFALRLDSFGLEPKTSVQFLQKVGLTLSVCIEHPSDLSERHSTHGKLSDAKHAHEIARAVAPISIRVTRYFGQQTDLVVMAQGARCCI